MKAASIALVSALALGATQSLSAQLPPVPTPPGNPTTTDKVNLGKVLFWDEQVSSTRTVACATCHNPDGGGADPRTVFAVHPGPDGLFGTADDIHGSPGVPLSLADGTYTPQASFGLDVQVTGRVAPTAINAAFNQTQFWDGREDGSFDDPITGVNVLPALASLEAQAANPPTGDAEMAHQGRDWNDVAARVAVSTPLALATDIPPALSAWMGAQSYQDMFTLVYGDANITPSRIIMAIAAYERVLISDQTPFDLGTMSPLQQVGKDLFEGKARCNICHAGPLFRNNNFHNTGIRPSAEDMGRFSVTGNPADMGAFKTPGLRNIGLRSGFFHTGSLSSLAEVIEFYDRGGDFFDNIDAEMQPLGLTLFEKVALLDFLQNGLTDPRVAGKLPPFDPPTLYTQTGRPPQLFGQGAAGSGGVVPRFVAVEPPMLGNPRMNLTITDGLGDAQAVLASDVGAGSGAIVAGVPIWVSGVGTVMLPLGVLEGVGQGRGFFSATLAIPATPALSGADIFLQAFIVDPGASNGLSATGGLQITLFD